MWWPCCPVRPCFWEPMSLTPTWAETAWSACQGKPITIFWSLFFNLNIMKKINIKIGWWYLACLKEWQRDKSRLDPKVDRRSSSLGQPWLQMCQPAVRCHVQAQSGRPSHSPLRPASTGFQRRQDWHRPKVWSQLFFCFFSKKKLNFSRGSSRVTRLCNSLKKWRISDHTYLIYIGSEKCDLKMRHTGSIMVVTGGSAKYQFKSSQGTLSNGTVLFVPANTTVSVSDAMKLQAFQAFF